MSPEVVAVSLLVPRAAIYGQKVGIRADAPPEPAVLVVW